MAEQKWEEEHFESCHMKLKVLKEKVTLSGKAHKCLFKHGTRAISDFDYPQPEFHVSHLKHDTGKTELSGIRKDGGLKDPKTCLVWWSLSVGEEEIESAEKRLIEAEKIQQEKSVQETEEKDRAEAKKILQTKAENQGSFLGEFATSPAFHSSSRMGSFRFTFPLEEVLKAYSKQFCSGAQPMMRVLKTVLYQQEVMYVVLVHNPAHEKRLSKYPLLSKYKDPVVTYEGGRFIWRSQSMCNTHSYQLVKDGQMLLESKKSADYEHYVWDHVAIALHVGAKVLKLKHHRLRENLTYCEQGTRILPGRQLRFSGFPEAEVCVEKLWPSKLQKAKALKQELRERAKALEQELRDRAKALEQELRDRAKALEQELRDRAKALEQELRDRAKALEKDLRDRAKALTPELGDGDKALEQELRDRAKALEQELRDRAKALEQELRERAEALEQELRERAKALEQELREE